MLRVIKHSGKAALAIPFTDWMDMIPMKRHLPRLMGQSRFRQRLVLSDGQMLSDDAALQGPMDAQLIMRSFEASSQDQIQQLQHNNILVIEQLFAKATRSRLATWSYVACSALGMLARLY